MTQEKPKFDEVDRAFHEVADNIAEEEKKPKDEDAQDAEINEEIKKLALRDKERDEKSIKELRHLSDRIYPFLSQGRYLLANLKEPNGENMISADMQLKDVLGILEERQKELAQKIEYLQKGLEVEQDIVNKGK